LIVRDANGCTVSRAFTIQKFDLPTITTADVTPPSCKGGDGVLKVVALSNALPLVYSLDSVRFTPKDTFLNMKSGIYTVQVRDSFGCIAKQIVTMPDPKLPIIQDIQTSIAECGKASAVVLIKATSPVGGITYRLDSSGFQTDSRFLNQKKGKYRVIVEDAKGCRAEAEAVVKSNCTLFIPTIFSPNGDNKNDVLSVFGNPEDVDKILVYQIYNRWGGLVFNDPTVRINDPTSGWNGKMNDSDLANDVFVCVVRVLMKSGEILDRASDVILSK
jgi:gliding motility-associated-like protein